MLRPDRPISKRLLLRFIPWLFAMTVLALFLLLHAGTSRPREANGTAVANAPLPAPPAQPVPEPEREPDASSGETGASTEPASVVTEGTLRRGDTLHRAMGRVGVPRGLVHLIAEEMAPVFNFRYAQPGDRYRLERRHDGDFEAFHYIRSPLERYELRAQGEGYVAERHEPQLIRRRARIAGLVSTSLYEAVEALGERPELARDFSNIFAWDVDFNREVQPGDAFSIVYERLHSVVGPGEEVYAGTGRVLAARYASGGREHRAVYFETAEGRGGYYRVDGSAVERQFLRAPLEYRRISSAYSLSRFHPILKVRRPHFGIDYAAPRGTNVWAVADGEVIFRGSSGDLGNLVKVRHGGGLVSYYGHLSGFAKGLRVGQRVQQKQVIGYVGATGLATGPHLDYRLKRDGRWVNPAHLDLPAGEPIPAEARARFAAARDELLLELSPPPLVVVNEAL